MQGYLNADKFKKAVEDAFDKEIFHGDDKDYILSVMLRLIEELKEQEKKR